jgi:hypothetical protein
MRIYLSAKYRPASHSEHHSTMVQRQRFGFIPQDEDPLGFVERPIEQFSTKRRRSKSSDSKLS